MRALAMPDDVLALAGVAVCDFTLVTERLANPSDIVYVGRGNIKVSIGGHPLNISIDLVKLGIDGSKVKVVASVGNDLCGGYIINTLKSYGIDTRWVHVAEDQETGKDMIIVIDGEDRRFHVDLGANLQLSAEHVIRALSEIKPSLFHVAVGLLKATDEALRDVLKAARNEGAITFVDVGVATRPSGDWEFLRESIKEGLVDVFHANSYEIRKVLGLTDLKEAIRLLLESGVRVVLITEGERGALLASTDFVVRQPSFKVRVVDPTGAGDAFQAGFLYYVFSGGRPKDNLERLERDPKEAAKALAYSQAVGAACVTAPGTTEAVTRDNVKKILAEQLDIVLKETAFVDLKARRASEDEEKTIKSKNK